MRRRLFPIVLLALACNGLLVRSAVAHDFSITRVVAAVEEGGRYRVDLVVDLDALLLGAPRGHRQGELKATIESMPPAEYERRLARLRSLFERRVRIRFDGEALHPVISFPDRSEGAIDAAAESVLGVTARLTGRVPAAANEFTFWASRSFGPVDLLVVDLGTGRSARQVLGVAEESAPFELGLPVQVAAPPSAAATVGEYLVLGFQHIVPLGVDHMLFVLALFLVARRLRDLFVQVTAFTVAHTLTLALSTLGLVDLPARVTESLIALSIALVAAEALVSLRRDAEAAPRWLWAVVFAFGLLHGLGFAGAIGELGLPSGRFVAGLVGFNLGVELGQLTVLAAAYALLGRFRDQPWYGRRVVLPVSLVIGAVGLWWTVERALLA